jgi:glucose-6-phosphate dehydrogenase assembly protein OpcA
MEAPVSRNGADGVDSHRWRRRDVDAAEIASSLARLRADHLSHATAHAATRTLNLVVMPCRGKLEGRVVDEVERLGAHSPARTIVLRDHSMDRLDADLALDCDQRPDSGQVGLCHDRVVLDLDEERLAHCDSLVAPLLVTGLPTVIWVADPAVGVADARLLARASHLVVDTASHPDAPRRAAELLADAPIADLAWVRLERWRAAVAAAWDPEERRAALGTLSGIELTFGEGARSDATLLAAWIVARAGLAPGAASLKDAGSGAEIERVEFELKSERLAVSAPTRPLDPMSQFATALLPLPSRRRGYREAIALVPELAAA